MSTARTGTPGTPQVHVTRRGRALLLVALVAVLFAAFSLGRANSQAASASTDPAPRAAAAGQITVQPGESLWAVARRIAPENDPREVMAQIRRLNELEGSGLQAGQHLLLPAVA